MRVYLEEELAGQRLRKTALRTRLEDMLLVEPGEDFGSVIVEIRAGTGGDEAAAIRRRSLRHVHALLPGIKVGR